MAPRPALTNRTATADPAACRAQTCDCEPGHCRFPLCVEPGCGAPLLNGEPVLCRECEERHLREGA